MLGNDDLWQRLWDVTTDAVVVLDRSGRIRYANTALKDLFGHDPARAIGQDVSLLQPERLRARHKEGFERHLKTGEKRLNWRSTEARGLHAAGHEFPIEIAFSRLDGGGEPYFVAFIRDITERKRATGRLQAQAQVLELIANASPLDTTLETITLLVEREFPAMACSILLLDESGARVRVAAAPSLPPAYNRAIEGEPIGPQAGSCGTAAFRKELVISSDIATDPLWDDYRAVALQHGLRACWSMPILSRAGTVLGTLAMYYREPRSPGERELEVIRMAATFAGIAIERTREDAHRREAVERFDLISKATNDVVWDWDLVNGRVWWNDAYYDHFGFRREETKPGPESWSDFIHPDERAAIMASADEVIHGGGSAWQAEYRFRRHDGEYVFVMDRGFVVRDPFGQAVRMLGAMVDLTERKQAEERLAQLAQFDTLTGLPNRALFRDRLEQAVARARRESWTTALAFVDLDRFKEVNDTLGHAAGDELLRVVARRLRACVRESDTVARLSGDEFTVILEDLKGADDVTELARKMLATLEEPVELEGRELVLSASIGFALFPDDGADAGELLRRADGAMYQAKGQGRSAFRRYSAQTDAAARGRLALETSLRRALERGELELHYQPIYRLGARELAGAEALLRWNHPERGLVPPVEFIELAETSGLIVPIGEWVAREALLQAAQWRRRLPRLRIAVNFSARQFRRDSLAAEVAAALAHARLDGEALILEITETLLMENPEGSRRTLDALREKGVRVALDDFGTGYSSLAYLRHFPIDGVKIDRGFVRDLGTDHEDAKIVRAMVGLARDLRLAVTAEGVETQGQLDFLLAHGCEFGQGYLFGKPEPAADFEKRLQI